MFVGVRLDLRKSESESDVASRWVHRESNLMFMLNSDKDQRNHRFRLRFLSVSVNPYIGAF